MFKEENWQVNFDIKAAWCVSLKTKIWFSKLRWLWVQVTKTTQFDIFKPLKFSLDPSVSFRKMQWDWERNHEHDDVMVNKRQNWAKLGKSCFDTHKKFTFYEIKLKATPIKRSRDDVLAFISVLFKVSWFLITSMYVYDHISINKRSFCGQHLRSHVANIHLLGHTHLWLKKDTASEDETKE